jgi:hypothetical protein
MRRTSSCPVGSLEHCRSGRTHRATFAGLAFALALGIASSVADQVEMKNGDRYVGKVVSLNGDALVLQSDVLGSLRLPRAQVALISLGALSATNAASSPSSANAEVRKSSLTPTNAADDLSATLRQLGANTNLANQVRAQVLGGAGDEANQKFSEMLSGLMNGSITANDLRAQAKTAADQLRALKREYGDEAGSLDGYLTILESFLKESESAGNDSGKSARSQSPARPESAPKHP